MYIQDLALNNLQGLIWHKNQPTNQPCNHISCYADNVSSATSSDFFKKQWTYMFSIELFAFPFVQMALEKA